MAQAIRLNPDYDPINAPSAMKRIVAPLRRAVIYGLISYLGLVLINNAELNLPNLWIAYLPMFIGVYVATQWLDRAISSAGHAKPTTKP